MKCCKSYIKEHMLFIVHCYHFFIVEIIVEGVNLIQMSK